MNLLQRRNKSLWDYINRFTKEELKVPNLDEKEAMIALQQETIDIFIKRSLAKKAPKDINALQEQAEKYIKVKEILRKGTTQVVDNNN